MPSFGNLLGFWALLALPVILAIHFLQRESRQVVTSTLFLLEQLAPKSAQGRRWEKLRNSATLWLQILAVLLLTWVLVQPRWLRPNSTQHVVIVLDSSISMLAFQDELHRQIDRTVDRLAKGADRTEWHLLESDISRAALYSGTNRDALRAAVRNWKPHLGAHDFTPALQVGEALLQGNGTLIFVSDRSAQLPEGVRLLAVGRPLENCGFCGLTITGREWRALVRNYGKAAQKRKWWMEAGGQRFASQELVLEPGQTASLTSQIPSNAGSCQLFLDGDSFDVDDRLPMVVPEMKGVRIAVQENSPFTDFFKQLVRSVESSEVVNAGADLLLCTYDPFNAHMPNQSSIVFVADPKPSGEFLPGNVVPETHPLTNDLNWANLLCSHAFRVPSQPGDQSLVWQGDRPLIFLRQAGSAALLVVNFDARASNALRLPAFVLLLHRFVEQVRSAKPLLETRNFETDQSLSIASDPALPAPKIAGQNGEVLVAPSLPGFFDVSQGDKIMLRGAAHFADSREADFRDAASVDDVSDSVASMVARNSQSDLLTPVWVLAMGATMVASWIWKQS